MKNINIIMALSATLYLAGCAGPEIRLAKVSEEVSAAGRKHDMDAINNLSSSITAEDLSPTRMKKYSDKAVDSMFRALMKISLYLPDEENYTLRMERAFKEKGRRGNNMGDDTERMYNAFIMSGLFSKAVALRREFPDKSLPEVPEIVPVDTVKSEGWWVYKVSEQGKKVNLQLLPKSGQAIAMVIRPGCEFAEMAADGIFADSELGPVFRAKGFMLTRAFDPAGVETVKKHSNFDAVYIARKSSDFPGFSLLRISPTFYFIKDGKILDEFSGWDNDGGGKYAKNKIRNGLAAIGIKTKTE